MKKSKKCKLYITDTFSFLFLVIFATLNSSFFSWQWHHSIFVCLRVKSVWGKNLIIEVRFCKNGPNDCLCVINPWRAHESRGRGAVWGYRNQVKSLKRLVWRNCVAVSVEKWNTWLLDQSSWWRPGNHSKYTKLTFWALALHQSESRQAYERRKSHFCYVLTVSPPVEFDLFMFPHLPLPP